MNDAVSGHNFIRQSSSSRRPTVLVALRYHYQRKPLPGRFEVLSCNLR